MGDPRKLRKKYSGPSHPWNKARIEEEAILTKEYGLKNKREIWKITSKLNNFKDQAKKLGALRTAQAEKERNALIKKLKSIGLLSETSTLGDVLSLSTKDLMERRLQTLVYKRGLAHSMKQSRQFIVHRHIDVADKKIISPAYIVHVDEEAAIRFSGNSPLKNEDHPERAVVEKKPKKERVPEERPGRGRGRDRRKPRRDNKGQK